jgi:DNA-binding XRE family transcriptional regulator
MNETTTTIEVPLHILLRRRREELALFQADVAERLHVTPECICQWEAGRRRMELSKLPRIAAVLQIDPRELCVRALVEFHPLVYAALFGTGFAPADIQRRPAA